MHQHRITSHSCTDGGRSSSECLENCKWFGEYSLPFWYPLSCLCGFWKRHWDSMEELIEFQISCYITHSMMPLHTNITHCWNNDKVNLAIRLETQRRKIYQLGLQTLKGVLLQHNGICTMPLILQSLMSSFLHFVSMVSAMVNFGCHLDWAKRHPQCRQVLSSWWTTWVKQKDRGHLHLLYLLQLGLPLCFILRQENSILPGLSPAIPCVCCFWLTNELNLPGFQLSDDILWDSSAPIMSTSIINSFIYVSTQLCTPCKWEVFWEKCH